MPYMPNATPPCVDTRCPGDLCQNRRGDRRLSERRVGSIVATHHSCVERGRRRRRPALLVTSQPGPDQFFWSERAAVGDVDLERSAIHLHVEGIAAGLLAAVAATVCSARSAAAATRRSVAGHPQHSAVGQADRPEAPTAPRSAASATRPLWSDPGRLAPGYVPALYALVLLALEGSARW